MVTSHNDIRREKKANMPLPRLALASALGQAAGNGAALATVASLPQLDERCLVAEAQAGSRTAFEELVPPSHPHVLRPPLNPFKRPQSAPHLSHQALPNAS